MACADCFSGSLHTGTPTGTTSTIHGLATYVSQPEDGAVPKGILVMIPDAFGWEIANNRLLCDVYAKKGGFLVYLPDFMNGTALPAEVMTLMESVTTPTSWFHTIFYKPFVAMKTLYLALPAMYRIRGSVSRPRVLAFFQALRTEPPPFQTSNLKIGAAGFCWGGQHVVFLCQNTPSSRIARHISQTQTESSSSSSPLIDCGFTAHPSFIKLPADIEDVVLPLSVAIGDEDMAVGKKDIVRMSEILEEKRKKTDGDHECVVLKGAKHGFAVRNGPDDEVQNGYAEVAERQALEWFERWVT